ncbi:MAG: formylglycine-generating enzyme family protein [Proteobacteria bacterium]|nr:formylglycine-generating enzyme family protein [Pseudomonadota bacterium]
MSKSNISKSEFEKAIDGIVSNFNEKDHKKRFSNKIPTQLDIWLFFFKGFVVQIKEENYLLPVDINIQSELDIENEGIKFSDLMFKFRKLNSKLTFLIVDAHYPDSFLRNNKGKPGLASLTPFNNTVVVFSDKPNVQPRALEKDHELFLSTFIKNLKQFDIRDMNLFKAIKGDVLLASNSKQTPWTAVANGSPVIIAKPEYNEPKKADSEAIKHTQLPNMFEEPTTGLEFVLIKGKCFWMGDAYISGNSDETPRHKVCLDDYYLSTHEVTQSAWIKNGLNNPSVSNQGDQFPVDNVSFDDAIQFIKRLNSKTKKNYRLPTEAEWEFACHESSYNRQYSWGNYNPLFAGDTPANLSKSLYFFNLAGGNKWKTYNDGFGKTSPVGSFKANKLGIFDLTGNVSEWTSDWYGAEYYKTSPRVNPRGPLKGGSKVVKGGSWADYLDNARCSKRNWYAKSAKSGKTGFRLALSAGKSNSNQISVNEIALTNETGQLPKEYVDKIDTAAINFILEFSNGDKIPGHRYILEYWDGRKFYGKNGDDGYTYRKNMPVGIYKLTYPDFWDRIIEIGLTKYTINSRLIPK